MKFLPALLLPYAFVSGASGQPAITGQPGGQSVSIGASATFQVMATGAAPLRYQWFFNTNQLPSQTNRTLTITDAALTSAGDYLALVTNPSGSITSRVAHLEVDPAFTKITTGSIVTDIGTGTACAWGDYDGDGFLDLIITSAYDTDTHFAQKNLLYRNNRNGTLTKATNTVVTTEARDWRGCSWVDYDNDGHLDLFVTSTDANGFTSQNELFRNNGDGTFTKMTSTTAGAIVPGGGGSEGPVWADYDRDGFVDVFVVRYGLDWLFHNNADGSFSLVPNSNGIPPDSFDTYRAAWAGFAQNGWPSLLRPIRLDSGCAHSLLFRGLGGGLFTNIDLVSDCGNATSAAWGDYDNDGNLDLFVERFGGVPNLLYRNNGDGTFQRMTATQVGSIASDVIEEVYDCAWGDYDNDGFLDLFLTVGGSSAHNVLYHNNGDGTFTRVLSGNLVNDPIVVAPACAWGDYDNDGFLDLFVVNGSDAAPARNLLYRNNGNSNAWIKVRLVGTASNRSAIGAKVRVQAQVRGRPMSQIREINTGNGFSGGSLEAHFGLGDATNIDQLQIEWPSGIVQTMVNVAPRQILTVLEHQTTDHVSQPTLDVAAATVGGLQFAVRSDPGAIYVLEASTNLQKWSKVRVGSGSGTQIFLDVNGTNDRSRFYRVAIP